MYLGKSNTRLRNSDNSQILERICDVNVKIKTVVEKYKDINNNNREDFTGYDLVFTLRYLFKTDEDETTIRNLINERDTRLIPRVDFHDKYQPGNEYFGWLTIKKDTQGEFYDIIEVEFAVKDLVQHIPVKSPDIIQTS